MLTSSAKAKGRNLQKWVRDKLLAKFPQLEAEDIKSTAMGQNGLDLQMSRLAMKFIPYGFEMKNHAQMTIYTHFEQAERGVHKSSRELEPVLVVKANHKKPLAVVDAEHFFQLLRDRFDIGVVNINRPDE